MLIKYLVLITDKIYCRRRYGTTAFTIIQEESVPLLPITVESGDLPIAASSAQTNDLLRGLTL